MILRKSSTRTDFNNPLSGIGTLLKNKMRQNWSAFLLYTLIALIIPIFTAILLGTENFGEALYNMVCCEEGQIWFCIASALAALLAAVYAWRTLHSKKSSYFVQKLPYRREAVFTANSLFGLLLFALPLLLMILIFVLMGAFALPKGSGTYFVSCLSYYVAAIASYIGFFTVFTFCAIVCGSMGVFLPVSVITLFLPTLFTLMNTYYASVMLGWDIENAGIIRILSVSPVVVYQWFGNILNMGFGKTLLHCLYLILGSAAVWFCTLLLYRKMKAERAENAFTFLPVQAVYKYLLLYLAMGLAGIIVIGVASGFFAFLLGIVLIALVGFICNLLMNMVLNKNAHRNVMRGWKAVCILGAVWLALFGVAFVRNMCTLLIPSASVCRDISFDIPMEERKKEDTEDDMYYYWNTSELPVLVSDKREMENLLTFFAGEDAGIQSDDELTYPNDYSSVYVKVRTVFGITLSHGFGVRTGFEKTDLILQNVTDENIIGAMRLTFDESNRTYMVMKKSCNDTVVDVRLDEENVKKIVPVYLKELEQFDVLALNEEDEAYFAYFHVISDTYGSYSFLVYNTMTETVKAMGAFLTENYDIHIEDYT